MRPRLVVVVTGTGTEVGKTWLSVELLRMLRIRGVGVGARKPAQSFSPGEGPTDAELLAEATGERPFDVCPEHRWYAVPMAPPMAAGALGLPPPALTELVSEVEDSWPEPRLDVGLVECAGGVASPQSADADSTALASALQADVVVLTGDAGLGTINLVRLGRSALKAFPLIVFLNRYDAGEDLHRRNLEWLRDRDGLEVVTGAAELCDRVVGLLRARV